MAFWTDAQNKDPKRAYRFIVNLGNMPNGAQWYAKAVKKPAITITEVDHSFLNHKFYYPGRAEWDTVEVTLVDPVSPDAAANTAAILQASGYTPPIDVTSTTTISKQDAVNALGGVIIQQIDSEGAPMETWTLWNPFITGVTYGDLSYEEDSLTEVTITIRYDWAVLETANAAQAGGTAAAFNKNEFFKPGS
tara:strand:+ start:883 stop:1458 length:576 start_codon:yes stop_codon:yes gene_type:complete